MPPIHAVVVAAAAAVVADEDALGQAAAVLEVLVLALSTPRVGAQSGETRGTGGWETAEWQSRVVSPVSEAVTPGDDAQPRLVDAFYLRGDDVDV